MDVVRERRRPQIARTTRIARSIAIVVAIVGTAAWAVPALFTHHDAGPAVSRDSLVIDTVTRGALERSVTAAGTLQPDRISIASTAADGIVTDVLVRAGAHVGAGSTIARLDNPDLRVAVADAAAQLDAASADLNSVREEGAAAALDARAARRTARAEDGQAQAQVISYRSLYEKGLIGTLEYRDAVIKSGETRDLSAISESKIAVGDADADAKIAGARARVVQLRAALDAKRAQLATLVVTAPTSGTVQSVAVDQGQRVAAGAEFARVAADRDLKAVLAIPESDVRGVLVGMPVRLVSSDAGSVAGSVVRFAPAAEGGTVAVDVALARVPASWRPSQSLTGTVVLGRVARALSVARPVGASDDSHVALYRLDASGTRAYRTSVAVGSGTDERVRVLSGLAEGDRVIVSDTSSLTAPAIRIQE